MKGIWQLIILVLSIYAIIEISIELLIGYTVKTQEILDYIDIGISFIFLFDFGYFLYKSENKKKYFITNFVDFLSSIPFISYIKILRVARIIKIFKVFRGFKELKPLITWLNEHKVLGILISYIIMLLVIVFYASLIFFKYEVNVNENVNNLFDSFWWAFITLTSVGYGDIFPVTTIGRIVAMLLTIAGMGLFSIVTAEFSTLFLSIVKKKKDD